MDAREKWREVRSTDTVGHLPLGPNTFDRWVHDPKSTTSAHWPSGNSRRRLGCSLTYEDVPAVGIGTTPMLKGHVVALEEPTEENRYCVPKARSCRPMATVVPATTAVPG